MNRNKRIKKALFAVEKNVLLIMSMVIGINLTVNLLVYMFVAQDEAFAISQFYFNVSFFGLLYIVVYAINQATTSIPFLISLNCPKKILAKRVIVEGIIRSLIVSFIFLTVNLLFFRSGNLSPTTIFGINLTTGSIVDTLLIFAVYFLLASITYNLLLLISLIGVKYGWKLVLTMIFFVLGTTLLLFKQILLLIAFGWQLGVFIILTIPVIIILNFINHKIIRKFNYKY